MTRNQLIAELRAQGYTGPVSYTKTKLVTILTNHNPSWASRNCKPAPAYEDYTPKPCTINEMHCKCCGSTDYEDIVANADEGYTACCNKTVVYSPAECTGH